MSSVTVLPARLEKDGTIDPFINTMQIMQILLNCCPVRKCVNVMSLWFVFSLLSLRSGCGWYWLCCRVCWPFEHLRMGLLTLKFTRRVINAVYIHSLMQEVNTATRLWWVFIDCLMAVQCLNICENWIWNNICTVELLKTDFLINHITVLIAIHPMFYYFENAWNNSQCTKWQQQYFNNLLYVIANRGHLLNALYLSVWPAL